MNDADLAAIVLDRIARGSSIPPSRLVRRLLRLGLVVEYFCEGALSRRRWIGCLGLTRAGTRWLGAFHSSPFGVELPANTSGAARRAATEAAP